MFGSSLGGGLGATQTQPAINPFASSSNKPSPFGSLGLGLQSQQQPQGSSIFGVNTQQPQTASPFGASTFGQPQQNPFSGLIQQPQQQPQPQQAGSLFGQKSVPEQIEQLYDKWNPASSTCAFQHYFYNYVGPEKAPFYRPTPREDEKKWEEALSRKPEAGWVPVIAIGFQELFTRIVTQMQILNAYNTRLHEINGCLEGMLQKHDLLITIRAMDAKRRHIALGQRCLALATKVQVLRNRGYAMGGDEEDLKKKLIELEKGVADPALAGRGEEIWARMVGIRERSKLLQEEMARMGKKTEGNGLNEDVLKQAEKVLSDYAEQISHLKKELAKIQQEFKAWEGE
ncbi:hypothetical protein FGG08_006033 [Glutinoglossum americanum]|uniref:Nucleoporin Nup54 alpha-helical domain-containing protein n=1 Tax=Glutinoglossum americanum TaxID=1670608 RepID=A0A9P8HTF7_9PEZI|nr:hypothetical protein FGG08_006033 [Glutinoglossum americanum]